MESAEQCRSSPTREEITTHTPTMESFEAELFYRTVNARTAAEYVRELETLCGLNPSSRSRP
jgi:hypothetical protein